ncbi:MAG: hypothetical protein AB9836_04550 [Aminipila sp.]
MLVSLIENPELFREKIMPDDNAMLHYIELIGSLRSAIDSQKEVVLSYDTEEKSYDVECKLTNVFLTPRFENLEASVLILEYIDKYSPETKYFITPPITVKTVDICESKPDCYYLEASNQTYRIQICR